MKNTRNTDSFHLIADKISILMIESDEINLSKITEVTALDEAAVKLIFSTHICQMIEQSANQILFFDRLFKLDTDILGAIFIDQTADILEKVIDKKAFFEQLFKLDSKLLKNILQEEIHHIFNKSGGGFFKLIEQILSLDQEIFKSIYSNNIDLEMISGTINETIRQKQEWVIEGTNNTSPSQSFILKNHILHRDLLGMTILKLIYSNIYDSLSKDRLVKIDSGIAQCLKKIYIMVPDPGLINLSTERFIENLIKLCTNNTVHHILIQSLAAKGDVYISAGKGINIDHHIKSNQVVAGVYHIKSGGIFINENNMDNAISTLFYEATNKFLQLYYFEQYNNLLLEQIDNDENILKMIKNEQKYLAIKYSQLYLSKWQQYDLKVGEILPENDWLVLNSKLHWLKIIMEDGNIKQFHTNILPSFAADLADRMIGKDNESEVSNISYKFANLLWEYLNKDLAIPLQELPRKYYESTEPVSAAIMSKEIALEALKLISTEDVSFEWFKTDPGRLAFQAQFPSIKINFIKEIFEELDDKNMEFIHHNLIILLQACSEQEVKKILIDELYDYYPNILLEYIHQNSISMLKEIPWSLYSEDSHFLSNFKIEDIQGKDTIIEAHNAAIQAELIISPNVITPNQEFSVSAWYPTYTKKILSNLFSAVGKVITPKTFNDSAGQDDDQEIILAGHITEQPEPQYLELD